MRTFILIVFGVILSVTVHGQNSCDNLYAKAIKFQQTMSVKSQNQAISYFQKARECYDSDAKKKLCTSQITTCRNTISLIRKKEKEGNTSPKKGASGVKDSSVTVSNIDKGKGNHKKVILSVNETVLKFKAKGGQFKKVKVSCNVDGWKVTEHPDWITYSVNNDNEIIIEAEKNPSKEERSGIVKIECRGESVSFAVLQSKKGLLNGIGL